MEKQHSLCLKVLRRLKEAGLHNEAMVIGSWCIYFYRHHFPEEGIGILNLLMAKGESNRIMDIFVSFPRKWKKSVVRALEVSDAMELFEILSKINN